MLNLRMNLSKIANFHMHVSPAILHKRILITIYTHLIITNTLQMICALKIQSLTFFRTHATAQPSMFCTGCFNCDELHQEYVKLIVLSAAQYSILNIEYSIFILL